MEKLDVFLLGKRVGVLESDRGKLTFHYLPEYLRKTNAAAISYSLPLQSEPFDPAVTGVFFDNLLPPDVVRKRLGKILHLSRHNIFGFLKAIGGDCAGAIALYPPSGTETAGTSAPTFRKLSDEEAAQILMDLPKRPLNLGKEEGFRISGTGAQDKLIACVKKGKILLPLFGAPSTHIIKPPVAAYHDSVFNEFFCMRLAQTMGLPAPECEILTLKDVPYYCVTRFDRQTADGQISRLHQEDFCQLFSVDPEKKYENEGGPTIPQCFRLIRKMRLGTAGQVDFLRRIIFNVLIGNGDAHAKNFSVLYRGKNIRLAPVYDLLCTEIYDSLAHETAMSIGGETSFAGITRESFSQMARECKIRSDLVMTLIDEMLEKITPASKSLAGELNRQHPSTVYAEICRIIKRQAARLAVK
ncbi:MAG: type II toxin-antitoxin system HipA family toxin [Lentisphaerae bacterium]|nr:type II toxin-antitoxin system HipA family toxin [Lentisphaerota bacterium]